MKQLVIHNRYSDLIFLQYIVAVGVIICLSACVVSPAQKIDNEADRNGFKRAILRGKPFAHIVYFNTLPRHTRSLHVYLEGDGTPWIRERRVARDPTPRNPLMLRLMTLDPAPSVYLGRPCYHGLEDDPPCNADFWTHGRYSQRVVNSMKSVLQGILEQGIYSEIVFAGHSGGGTLAMLLAEQFPQTSVIITLAGNLDPDAWAEHHTYTPLHTSLNPSRRPPLNPDIKQLHFSGGQDQVMPEKLIRLAVSHQYDAELRTIKNYDHACCWVKLWPAILEELTGIGN